MTELSSKQEADSNAAIDCGVIMPISSIGDCSDAHWGDVLSIIAESVEKAGFRASLVSSADEVSVIQRTIVQNVYNSPVVICDVSEKNANVMFELGLRLAFDKPTIIIKDDKTSYSFDTGVIEHIEYPRDLRFGKIVEFKKKLAEKVLATYEKQQADPTYSTFLRHFGQFKLSKIDETEIGGQEFILKQLEDLKRSVDRLPTYPRPRARMERPDDDEIDLCCGPLSSKGVEKLKREIDSDNRTVGTRVAFVGDHLHLIAKLMPEVADEKVNISEEFKSMTREIHRDRRQIEKRLR